MDRWDVLDSRLGFIAFPVRDGLFTYLDLLGDLLLEESAVDSTCAEVVAQRIQLIRVTVGLRSGDPNLGMTKRQRGGMLIKPIASSMNHEWMCNSEETMILTAGSNIDEWARC